MNVLVIDASAVVELILETEPGLQVAKRIGVVGAPLVAPAHLDAEVLAAVRRAVLQELIPARDGNLALGLFDRIPIDRTPLAALVPRAFELRASVSAGDALYVALAEAIDAPILTTDVRLSGSNAHRAQFDLVR